MAAASVRDQFRVALDTTSTAVSLCNVSVLNEYVCMYMYVCMFVCMYVCMYTRMHLCMHVLRLPRIVG